MMQRMLLAIAIATLGIGAPRLAEAHGQNQNTTVAATPENAAAFLGDWTIIASGSYGEAKLALTLKAADGKVTGEVTDTSGKHELTSVSKSGTSLVFVYYFNYEGQQLDAVGTLTPADQKVDAVLQFASGAAEFVGTATRKESGAAPGVAGTWKGSMDTQAGVTETVLTLQPGSAVAGTMKVAQYEGTIEKGRLDGDKISFEIDIEPGKIACEGTVAADEMKLTVTGTTGTRYPLTLNRQK